MKGLLASVVVVIQLFVYTETAEILIRTGFSGAHQVRGDLYADVGTREFIVKNFGYDGTAPAAYFYVYLQGSSVSRFGGGRFVGARLTRSYGGSATVRRTIPDNINIADIHTWTIWCEAANQIFVQISIPDGLLVVQSSSPSPLPSTTSVGSSSQTSDIVTTSTTTTSSTMALSSSTPSSSSTPTSMATPSSSTTPSPTSAPPPQYDNCEVLSDVYQVSWQVDSDNDALYVKVCGCVGSGDYMAFGISGSASQTQMPESDVVVASYTDEDASPAAARDYYLTRRDQCINTASGYQGACPDDVQNANNNATVLRGSNDGDIRCVEYVRPISASEPQDIAVLLDGTEQYIAWAIGPIEETENAFARRHFTEAMIGPDGPKINFNRGSSSCIELICPVEICPPFESTEMDLTDGDHTLIATIGPSGGERGYQAITGVIGWGIGWYLNDTLIPVLRVKRGNTYTFRVFGGDDPDTNVGSDYHPFYITDDKIGGRLGDAQTRARETVIAGLDVNNEEDLIVGTFCEYKPDLQTSFPTLQDCTKGFSDYFNTLTYTCASNSPTAGVLQWTPDDSTPDIVYYQCATHRSLGWKIIVEGCPPFESTEMDLTDGDHTLIATLGPSGGERGYQAITGAIGWGVGWYLNDTLIPVLRVKRGNTYTFRVFGGDDPDTNGGSDFHPFYITDDKIGGRLGYKATKERETVIAGLDVNNEKDLIVGTYCEYRPDLQTSFPTLQDCTKGFSDYFNTLNYTCASNSPTAGVLKWTPDDSTPNIVYYQCANHRYFGWKIIVEPPLSGGSKAGVVGCLIGAVAVAALFVLI